MTPQTIDQSVIERLSALLEAATLDRWKHEPIYRGGQLVRNSIVADGREIAYDVNDARDADLIVAMKNALPAILASLSPSPIAGKEGETIKCCGEYIAGTRCPACPDRQPAECVATPGDVGKLCERLRDMVAHPNIHFHYLDGKNACEEAAVLLAEYAEVKASMAYRHSLIGRTVARAERAEALLTQMEAREQAMREALEEIERGPIVTFEFDDIQFNKRSPIEIARAALLNPTPTEDSQ